MLTRLPLPLDLNSFEVCDISSFRLIRGLSNPGLI